MWEFPIHLIHQIEPGLNISALPRSNPFTSLLKHADNAVFPGFIFWKTILGIACLITNHPLIVCLNITFSAIDAKTEAGRRGAVEGERNGFPAPTERKLAVEE